MTPTNKEQAHEIRTLEHDLENLERCYAALEQSARWAKLLFFMFIAALIALVLWGVVIDNLELAAMSLFALICCTLFRFNWRFKRIRWIDIVSYNRGRVQRTEAKAIEDMIADRKARLAALRRE
jgi:Flp pilus assembly protein TadB